MVNAINAKAIIKIKMTAVVFACTLTHKILTNYQQANDKTLEKCDKIKVATA